MKKDPIIWNAIRQLGQQERYQGTNRLSMMQQDALKLMAALQQRVPDFENLETLFSINFANVRARDEVQLKSYTKSGNPTLGRLDVRKDCIIGLTTTARASYGHRRR
jgi:hypothetical protein